jgi:hypothetical protein
MPALKVEILTTVNPSGLQEGTVGTLCVRLSNTWSELGRRTLVSQR